MRILAIDPGVMYTGIAFKESETKIITHTVTPPEDLIGTDRQVYLVVTILNYIITYQPEIVVFEDYGFGRGHFNVEVAELVGALKYALNRAAAPVDILFLAPNTVKFQVTGEGRAKKPLVAAKVKELYGNIAFSSHESDALAIMHTFVKYERKEMDKITERKISGRIYRNA